MFRALRKLLTAQLLVLLALISGLAMMRAAQTALPDTIPQRDLWRILAEEEITAQSPTAQAELVRRLEAQALSGEELPDRMSRLSGAERRQLEANLPELARLWFEHSCHEYFEQPEARRTEFLDGKIALFERWTGAQGLSLRERRGSASTMVAGLMVVSQQLERSIEKADPNLQPQLREFHIALRNRLIARQLNPTGDP